MKWVASGICEGACVAAPWRSGFMPLPGVSNGHCNVNFVTNPSTVSGRNRKRPSTGTSSLPWVMVQPRAVTAETASPPRHLIKRAWWERLFICFLWVASPLAYYKASHLATLAADCPADLSPILGYHGSSLLPTFSVHRALSTAGTAQEARYDPAPTWHGPTDFIFKGFQANRNLTRTLVPFHPNLSFCVFVW